MSKDEKVSGPQSSTGIIRFYDADTGGPKLDPKTVVMGTIVIIVAIKIVTIVMGY